MAFAEKYLAPGDYLARERLSGEKHEYYDGRAFAELTEISGLESRLELRVVPGRIPLSRIYNRVDLPENPGR